MSRNAKLIGGFVILVVLAVGVFLFLNRGGTGEASREIEAEEITQEVSGETASSGGTIFSIDSTESEVRFTLNEELMGSPTTVVGTTDQVAGQINVDFEQPSNTILGPITINVRTLATNSDQRNRQIRQSILRSAEDAYEFTTFTPTRVEGLPESITIGEPFTITVAGNLTLVDTTNEVVFEVTITPESETRISGLGTANVLRSDFNLQIPSVQTVANVTDEVLLEIEFVAVPATAEATEAAS